MVANFYSIVDFTCLCESGAATYALPDDVVGVIGALHKIMEVVAKDSESAGGGAAYEIRGRSSAPVSKERHGRGGGGGRSGGGGGGVVVRGTKCIDDSWTTVSARPSGSGGGPSFRPTKLDVKEGVEKDINDIRTFLNKISNKNYEKQKDAIVDHIANFVELESARESRRLADAGESNSQRSGELLDGGSDASGGGVHRIAQFVFDIASTNKFFSEIYADLYRALVARFAVFRDILESFVEAYTKSSTAILYVDPAVDYDGFCLYTKENDRRKATASFIVMLMLRGVLSRERVAGIVEHFMRAFLAYVEHPDRGNEIEEIAETLFVLITVGKAELKQSELWKPFLLPAVSGVAQMKPRSLPSLTNRAVFKFMDIMDKVRA